MRSRVIGRLAASLVIVGAVPLAISTVAPADPAGGSVTPSTLRVNTQSNPIGLGDATPNLSWRLSGGRQSAYEIRVASSEAQLANPDLWDSGKVSSSDTSNIVYAGAALSSRQAVVWDVRAWDGSGAAGDWSAPATWEMGLLANGDWSGKWIENPDYTYLTNGVPTPLPIFAKPFQLSGQVAKARLYMTGLGQYAAKLNGQPVGDAVLEPGQTSYYAEVNYRTYDVTSLLKPGGNLLGVETGSGAYQRVITPGRYFFQNNPAPVYGTPKVIAELDLTYADGSKQTHRHRHVVEDAARRRRPSPPGGRARTTTRAGRPTDWTASSTLSGTWRDASLVNLTADTTPTDTTPLIADQRPPVTVQQRGAPGRRSRRSRAAGLSTTLAAPASAGDTNAKLASVTGLNPGDTLTVAGEARKITGRRYRGGRRDDALLSGRRR